MKRRIFIESDVLHDDELRSVQRKVMCLLEDKSEPFIENVFDETLDYAWHDLGKTWEAVKKADEIYADSSLMPLVSDSYMGAPVIFNAMCQLATKENVTGKSVFILRRQKDIHWDMIDLKIMKKAFKENSLYMYDDEYENIIKVDVQKIK